MANSVVNTAPFTTPLQRYELHAHLYLHHTVLGANHNQASIVNPKHPNNFGSSVVNDWAITEGPRPDSKVIARARGIHIQAGLNTTSYYVSFNMVFEEASSFEGSTLQVMGPVVERDEWAVVGGTGEFTMAQGVIYKTFHEQLSEGNIMEIDVHAIYTPMERTQSNCGKNVWNLGA